MSGDRDPDRPGAVVNLNRARKARDKVARKTQADANAVRFGRPRADRDAAAAKADKATRDLDGHRKE